MVGKQSNSCTFSAVNESVLKHNKQFLLPLAIVAFVEYLKVKDLSKLFWPVFNNKFTIIWFDLNRLKF